MNLIDYIKENKDKTFEEFPFNEVDNLVFSELAYLNYTDILKKEDTINLNELASIYLKKHKITEISKTSFGSIDAYRILKNIIDTNRYKDLEISNYTYIGNRDVQFGALIIRYKKLFTYVSYEGTDDLLSGWKENFNLVHMYPTLSHKYAIDYINKNIKFTDRRIYIGGHSKGGNLALVAGMGCSFLIRLRLKKIFSNDGPGLRLTELNSRQYKKIKKKYVHIVPNYSYVGVLLRNDTYKVIKSTKKDVLSHSVLTWEIKKDHLVTDKLSTVSKNLQDGTLKWLDEHDYNERKKIIINIFNALEKNGISRVSDFIKIKNTIKIIDSINSIDKETRKLIMDLIKFNIDYLKANKDVKNI